MRNILIIYYFAINQKYSKIIFQYDSLAIFAGNTQKQACPHPPPPPPPHTNQQLYHLSLFATKLECCYIYYFGPFIYLSQLSYKSHHLKRDLDKVVIHIAQKRTWSPLAVESPFLCYLTFLLLVRTCIFSFAAAGTFLSL